MEQDGAWWRRSVTWLCADANSSAATTTSVSLVRLTGLGVACTSGGASGILTAEARTHDIRGNVTVRRTVIDRDNRMVYELTDVPDSTIDALSIAVNVVTQLTRSTHGLETTYAHDPLRRPVATQDARGAVRSRGYDSKGRVAWESDPATNGTWFAYDSIGRRIAVTNALGQVTHTAYDLEGRVIATWGATYPVAYEYDQQGRMVAMATTRDPDLAEVNLWEAVPNCPLDRTRWLYDEATTCPCWTARWATPAT